VAHKSAKFREDKNVLFVKLRKQHQQDGVSDKKTQMSHRCYIQENTIERVISLLSASPKGEARCRKVWIHYYHPFKHHMHRSSLLQQKYMCCDCIPMAYLRLHHVMST
jgi:hypothetical protein